MTFDEELRAWLIASLATSVPIEVKAFAFNLFETAGDPQMKFGIELVGAGQFDPIDEEWPCYEVWEPKQRQLGIPIAISSDTWKVCLVRMRDQLVQILGENSSVALALKSRSGVGLGFVDGNLELLWHRGV